MVGKKGDQEMNIKIDKPIGYFYHKPTKVNIAVYKPINWFRRMMIKMCFGLEYKEEQQ